jgi:hypothetical protein
MQNMQNQYIGPQYQSTTNMNMNTMSNLNFNGAIKLPTF